MRDYDKDLVSFYEQLGDAKFESEDPVFTKRCLSAESPMGLVDRAARSLDRTRLTEATEGFDTFTSSRVFSALGKPELAEAGYLEIITTSDSPHLRGKALINLAADCEDDKKREEYHKQALTTGWLDAYAAYGQFLLSKKRDSEAKVLLQIGLREGSDLCLAVLGFMFSRDLPLKKHMREIEEIATLAAQKGIDINKAFDRWDERIIGRKRNGEVINLLRVSRETRKLFKEIAGA